MTWQQLEARALRPYSCEQGQAVGMVCVGMPCACPTLRHVVCFCPSPAPASHPGAAPEAFWAMSNRMYRCFAMRLLADTLQVRNGQ